MIRKHFRFKRLVLGFAVAAVLAPAAQAHVYLPASHLGQPLAAQTTITPLQADGMRWTAMANFYKQQSGVPPATAVKADGLRYQAMAKFYGDKAAAAATSSTSSNGFSWSDAGIGASAVFAGLLVLLTVVGLGRRHRSRGGLASA
jgi:hypothetical protein